MLQVLQELWDSVKGHIHISRFLSFFPYSMMSRISRDFEWTHVSDCFLGYNKHYEYAFFHRPKVQNPPLKYRLKNPDWTHQRLIEKKIPKINTLIERRTKKKIERSQRKIVKTEIKKKNEKKGRRRRERKKRRPSQSLRKVKRKKRRKNRRRKKKRRK